MAKVSEVTFGARILRAKDLHQFTVGFTNYAPSFAEGQIAAFGAVVADALAANATEATASANYSLAVAARIKFFKKEPTSIIKLVPLIRGAVASQYGKDSAEAKKVGAFLTKLVAAKNEGVKDADGNITRGPSQSEMSFGSQTQTFSNLITTLETFNNFNPSRVEIQLPTLRNMLALISQANTEVATTLQQVKVAKETRRNLYEAISTTSQRIKDYVKSNYGPQSNEYKLVKGLLI